MSDYEDRWLMLHRQIFSYHSKSGDTHSEVVRVNWESSTKTWVHDGGGGSIKMCVCVYLFIYLYELRTPPPMSKLARSLGK